MKMKIGIRPTIDGRWGGIREGLEAQTMKMAEDAKKFAKIMILVLLPATQGIYGFVMALVGQMSTQRIQCRQLASLNLIIDII